MPSFHLTICKKTQQSHSNPSLNVPFEHNEPQFSYSPSGLVSTAMTSPAFSFTTSFFPSHHRLITHHSSLSSSTGATCDAHSAICAVRGEGSAEQLSTTSRRIRPSYQLSPVAATLAAVAVMFSKISASNASVDPTTMAPPSKTPLHSLVQHDNCPSDTANTQGTLIRVQPRAAQDTLTDSGEILQNQSSPQSNTSTLPQSAAGIQGWVSSRFQRTLRASKPVRARVRPATLGLVGVGAFTSGSALLRSITRNNARKRDEPFLSATGVCSVVSMQIPFCVSDRIQMLQTFDGLVKEACIDDAEGMANASRIAATVLLEEEGLLEDSTKFAPYIDVFLAENLASAERRFACQVGTEESRLQKIEGYKNEESQMQRLYGVTTMIVATTEGVDLECYDEHSTLVSRLRHALDSISKLRAGEVAGLELVWVPEDAKYIPLTRAQISDAYPWLKIG